VDSNLSLPGRLSSVELKNLTAPAAVQAFAIKLGRYSPPLALSETVVAKRAGKDLPTLEIDALAPQTGSIERVGKEYG
jgi:hypothetical protein